MRLLIIDDEKKTADTLKKGLEENGYSADVAYDGLEGLSLLQKNDYEIIISDVIMPNLNGIELSKQIRKISPEIPILLLSALDAKDSIVSGFDAGVDDYLTKPFDFRELLARLRRLSKRSGKAEALLFSDLEMNLSSRQVSRSGIAILLSAKEFKLLEYFMRNPNTVLSRSQLARDIWNVDFDTGTNIVEVYINYLRNKIDKPFTKKLIHNLHGIGYILKEESA